MTEFNGENIPVDKLPQPTGWFILVGGVKPNDMTAGGIYKPASVNQYSSAEYRIAKVLAVGNLVYQDDQFKGAGNELKPFCKVGDIIMTAKYTGQDVYVKDNSDFTKLKIMKDEEVLSVIPNLSFIEV